MSRVSDRGPFDAGFCALARFGPVHVAAELHWEVSRQRAQQIPLSCCEGQGWRLRCVLVDECMLFALCWILWRTRRSITETFSVPA